MSGSLAVGAGAIPQAAAEWKPKTNPWLIAVVVTLAAFMEVLDGTIVNVSLPHIAGSMSVSYDDAAWALTSYLVANGIVLTLSGWLSDVFGRKRYFMICIAMFTVCSLLCGLSANLWQLILFRLLQGFFGGGLQPNQQSIILDTFTKAQRPRAMSVVAVATVVAPILGPTLGGYITDDASWRWVFFLNIPIGAFALFAVGALVEDPPWVKARRAKGVDYVGISLITLGLGALQLMMDRGQDSDWFASPFIRVTALLAGLGLLGAVGWLLTVRNPVVNLRVLANRNFGVAVVLVMAMTFVLYSSSIVLPQLAQEVLGYTATLAGLVISPGALCLILLIPIVNRLMQVVQPKYLVVFGFAAMGAAMFFTSDLTPTMSFNRLLEYRIAQSVGMAFLFVPISTLAYTTLPREMNGDAAALYTMSRNVAGSIGISTFTAFVMRRSQARQSHLSEAMSPLNAPYNALVAHQQGVLQSLGRTPAAAHSAAVGEILRYFQSQVSILAYSDVYLVLGTVALAIAPLALFFSKMRPGAAPAPAAH